MEQEISKYLLQLRRSHPFLATISLFATYRFTEETGTFLSQGKNILINPDFFSRTPGVERVGLLLHVTLHTALQHSARCGLRNKDIWNIAADIVVNNIILETGKFSPPSGTVIIPHLNNLSVEQVYEHLVQSQKKAHCIYNIFTSASCHTTSPWSCYASTIRSEQPAAVCRTLVGDSSALCGFIAH